MIQKDLQPPQVTVVVVNLNRRQLLEACLRSLERQAGVSFETIIVDNASTDGSPEWVEEYSRSAPYPVSLIRNQENRGFCGSNNQGIARARGQFIALLNNDAEAEPGWLEQLLIAFTRSPGIQRRPAK